MAGEKGAKRKTPGAMAFSTVIAVLLVQIPFVQSGEFTFELADRDQQCFHEEFKETGKEIILEFQVSELSCLAAESHVLAVLKALLCPHCLAMCTRIETRESELSMTAIERSCNGP